MSVCAALVAAACVAVARCGGLGKPYPFEINLDDPPEQRWVEVATAYKDVLPAMLISFDDLLTKNLVDSLVRKLLRHNNLPAEHIAELSGIVQTVDSEHVTLDRLVLFQMFVELALPGPSGRSLHQASAGIIAANESGAVFHGRNFDSELFFIARGRAMNLEDAILALTWKRNGTTLFTSIGPVGQIGVHTGMTSGPTSTWSIQQSSRGYPQTTLDQARQENLKSLQAGGKVSMPYIRSLMESGVGFKDAVLRLERSRMCAEQYFLLAGSRPWDGAIIAVDRATHEDSLNNVQVLSQEIGRWFLVQAGDDIWTDSEDRRRPEGVELVALLGQSGMSVGSLVTTMRIFPMFAMDTVFTWAASLASSESRVFMGSERVEDAAGVLELSAALHKRRV
mmetsp:Transcript_37932/g.102722  ORF Transcript_37932/g.102722 Transcript_37932/m.102722 type:complete len:394 (-) Transcript_37932:29-1210(-)|eukprot:CAMPEP_0171174494 /NCGR_PEP_ID=MMETSP0790-20130122/10756_1 /TAXON_ID=2925 /ORGANISM="Alexandrium catenella, Strain OF101" /LENGTH=393 /DNA_ID=CAMNT_0011639369 /DNA_START=191 /DNA_END=1372 /DNA_ORIENTATION=+